MNSISMTSSSSPIPPTKSAGQPPAMGFRWEVSPQAFVTDAGPSFSSRAFEAAVIDSASTSMRAVGA